MSFLDDVMKYFEIKGCFSNILTIYNFDKNFMENTVIYIN